MCGIIWCYTGPEKDSHALFRAIRDFGPPAFSGIETTPFPALQSAFDVLYPPGLHWYWKTDFFNELTDNLIALHVEHGSRLSTMHSMMQLYPMDGAGKRASRNDTPFSNREADWAAVMVGRRSGSRQPQSDHEMG
jgi:hypothetical protein